MFKIIKNLLVEKPANNDKDLYNNILLWSSRNGINDYPTALLKAIAESPTASACMSTKVDYTRGSGFNIPDLEKIKVNQDEKLNSLHNGLAETVTKLRGIAIHVKRDLGGQIVSLTKVPFEDIRLKLPNDDNIVNKVIYNPRWDQREFKKSESIEYDLYTSDLQVYQKRVLAAKEKGEKYKGEIYWNCIKKDGFPYYPYPFSEFDIKAFETDGAFTNYDFNNIKNNFFLGGIINLYGDPYEVISEPYMYHDKSGNLVHGERELGTREELFNIEMQKRFSGDENAGSFMINWMKNENEKLDVAAFPSNTNSDLFEKTQDRIWNKISHITKVPTILANIQTAGKLGNSQEILNAIELINNSVTIQQSLLEEAYKELLPKHINFKGVMGISDVSIKRLKPINYIPDVLWQSIPDRAKRKYIKDNYDIDIDEDEL